LLGERPVLDREVQGGRMRRDALRRWQLALTAGIRDELDAGPLQADAGERRDHRDIGVLGKPTGPLRAPCR
jgi:hypothetical protein